MERTALIKVYETLQYEVHKYPLHPYPVIYGRMDHNSKNVLIGSDK